MISALKVLFLTGWSTVINDSTTQMMVKSICVANRLAAQHQRDLMIM
jgi:hypothetical protein